MVVCHCKAVNDGTIRAALEAGSASVEEITDACGAGSQCGGCVDTIRSLVSARDETAVTLPAC